MPLSYVQSHIHLSTTLSGAPEHAPDIKWLARNRDEEPVKYFEISTTLEGNVFDHVIGNDNPITRTNMEYDIVIRADSDHDAFYYKDILRSMDAKRAYLVDHYHPNDGDDHTNSVIQVMVDVQKIPLFTTGLHLMYIPVILWSLVN